jgi:hypothetical protein
MAEQQRAFKGVWIPAEIWLNENLSLPEKAVLAEINSFCSRYESCYASNEHFAKFIQVGERRIQKILKSLESKELIEREIVYKKGTKEIEKRFLRVREGWCPKVHGGNEQKFMGGGDQKFADNIPSFNKPKNSKVNIYSYAENRSDAFKEAWQGFIDMRKANKKPMTERAAQMILKKLDKLSGGDEATQIAILDKSVVKCWSDVYELKEQYGTSKQSNQPSQEPKDLIDSEIDWSKFDG